MQISFFSLFESNQIITNNYIENEIQFDDQNICIK